MAAENKSNVVKAKASGQDGSSSSSSINKKKIVDTSTKQPLNSKLKSIATITNTEVKTKATSSSSTIKKTTTVKTREKKVYTLPGQKYDVPEEREPLRIFYESLSEQISSSEMAEFWMMEHGLLSPERAKKAYEKKQRKQKQIRMGTPIKSLPPQPSRPSSSIKQQQGSKNGEVKAKKRIINDSDEDIDYLKSPKRSKGCHYFGVLVKTQTDKHEMQLQVLELPTLCKTIARTRSISCPSPPNMLRGRDINRGESSLIVEEC